MMNHRSLTTVLLVALSLAAPKAAAAPTQQPPAVAAAAVTEHLGERVPLELGFTSAQRTPVRLGELVRGDRPVLLVLAYARCEMLCSVVLQGVADAVAGMDSLAPGRDYQLIVVSIDARESADEAARKQTRLLERIGHPGETARWPYLIGREADIRALAASLGFGYAWDAAAQQYAHPAVAFVLTPDGRIARYLYGVQYPAATLAVALRSASRGVLQPTAAAAVADDIIRCFRFDPGSRRYGARIQRYFRAGAILVFGMLAGLVGGLILWERRRAA